MTERTLLVSWDADERYPEYWLHRQGSFDFDKNDALEVTEAFMERYERITAEFNALQHEVGVMIEEASP